MAVSGFFGRQNLKNISIDIEADEEVYAKSETGLRITVANKRRFLPLFLIRAQTMKSSVLFHYLDPGQKAAATIKATFDKRGINNTDSITLCSIFPFNFFERCVRLSSGIELIVLPEPMKCTLAQSAHEGKRQADGIQSENRGYESGIISLRPYQAGDPLRHIHWKAAAKTDKLLTKEFPSSNAEPVLINFDELDIADIETRISCTAYAIQRLIRQGTPAGLVIEKKIYKPALGSAHRLKMLKELALYGTR